MTAAQSDPANVVVVGTDVVLTAKEGSDDHPSIDGFPRDRDDIHITCQIGPQDVLGLVLIFGDRVLDNIGSYLDALSLVNRWPEIFAPPG